MPRGRPKMIGALLPKGGYRALMSKKRLDAKAAYYASASKKVLSGANRQRRRKVPMSVSVMTDFSTATTPKVKRTASPAQLAALAKARAARAAKKTGTTVAVAVAAPKRTRARMIGPKLPGGGYKTLLKKNAANIAFNTLPTLAYGEYF